MDLVITFLKIVDVIIALLLIGIILIQQSKAGSGLSALGGAMTEQFLGATAGNVLTKATVVLAALFLGLTLVLAILSGHHRPAESIMESPLGLGVLEETASPAVDGNEQSVISEGEPEEATEAIPEAPANGSADNAEQLPATEETVEDEAAQP